MLSSNDVKYFSSLKQKKYRNENGQFLIEGFHLVEECLSSPYEVEYIILRNGVDLTFYPKILDKISRNKTKVEPLAENLFNKLVETESSQGIVGVVNVPEAAGKISGDMIVALDRVNDPGNLGTIIRTAYWFNAGSVLVSENSADAFNSKVIRSSQGAVFFTNIIEDADLNIQLPKLKSEGYNVLLFTLDAENYLDEIEPKGNNILVFGSEAHGISDELLQCDYNRVKIRGYSDCESLNVGVSAGIALNHFAKRK